MSRALRRLIPASTRTLHSVASCRCFGSVKRNVSGQVPALVVTGIGGNLEQEQEWWYADLHERIARRRGSQHFGPDLGEVWMVRQDEVVSSAKIQAVAIVAVLDDMRRYIGKPQASMAGRGAPDTGFNTTTGAPQATELTNQNPRF